MYSRFCSFCSSIFLSDKLLEIFRGYTLSGKEFCDYFPKLSTKLVKLTNEEDYNKDYNNDNKSRHISFTDEENLYLHLKYDYGRKNNKYYRTVTLPPDCKIYIDQNKFKADKIILGEREEIKNLNIWKDRDYCMKSVTKNGDIIRYITDPSEEIQLAALEQNCRSIKYIKNPTINAQIFAVSKDGYLLSEISNPTDEVQLAAVMKSPFIVNSYPISEKVRLEMTTPERQREFDEKNIFL